MDVRFRNPLKIPIDVTDVRLACEFEADAGRGLRARRYPRRHLRRHPRRHLRRYLRRHPRRHLRRNPRRHPRRGCPRHRRRRRSEPGETTTLRLGCTPSRAGTLRIVGVTWTLCDATRGFRRFDVRAPRTRRARGANGALEWTRDVPREKRLAFTVVPAMPRLEVSLEGLPATLPREPPRSRRFACETSRAAGRTAARERVPPRTAFACVFRRAASPSRRRRRRGRNRRRVGGEKRVGGKKPVGREKRVGVRPVEERVAERLADVTVVRRTDRDDVRTSCVVASPRGRGGDDGAVDSPDRDGRGGRSRGGVLRTAAARAAPAEIPNSSVCRGNDRDAVDGGVRDRRERRDAPRGARRSRVGDERDVRDQRRRSRRTRFDPSRSFARGTDRARHSRRWARPRRRRGSSRPVDDGTPFFSRRPRRRSKTRRSTRTPRTSSRRRFESAPRRNPNRHPGLARRWFGCTARPRPNGSEAEAPPIRERRARTPRTRTDARTCSTGSTSSWSGRRFRPSGPIASARSARTISAPSPIPSPRTDPTGGIADHSTPRRRSGTFVGPSRDRRRRRSPAPGRRTRRTKRPSSFP